MTRPVLKGDRFVWNEGTAGGAVYVEVLRVARDGTWADIRCTTALDQVYGRPAWTKRQPTPFPAGFRRADT